jgi:SAM-dependent methyltransferase
LESAVYQNQSYYIFRELFTEISISTAGVPKMGNSDDFDKKTRDINTQTKKNDAAIVASKEEKTSQFFEDTDWDQYWDAEVSGGSFLKKLVSIFRIHFDNEYVKHVTSLIPSTDVKILEVGCGTGYSAHKLGEMGYRSIALDYSPQAKIFWDREIANFFVADGFHIPFKSDSFDLVWNAGVLEHFPDPQPMLKEMIRVCKPGGTVCIIVPYIFDILAYLEVAGEENIFTKKKLKNELRELDDVGIKVLYTCAAMLISGWGRKRSEVKA